MDTARPGQIAVIFASHRTLNDDSGYAAAAIEMEALAMLQPGYRGIDSARGDDRFGITVSYWADDAAAIAWRDHPRHAAIRAIGRGCWYDRYSVTIARIERHYDWAASAEIMA